MGSRGGGIGAAAVLALAAVVVPWQSTARAQTDQDKAVATTLFEEGRTLLAAGKVSEACRKLEESRRLDPLPGTVLNLATCHEREGLTASAVAEFRQARAMAERDHRDDRVAFAEEHIRALEPRLSMLVIVVGPGVDVPDLAVTFDGVALGRAAWGTRIPVDPGPHVIATSAPGKQARRIEVRVGPDGDVQTATIEALVDAPQPPSPEPVPPASPAPQPPAPPALVEAPPPRPAGLSSRRTWALVSGGAGVVAAGIGTYFGLTAIAKHNDSNATCTTNPCHIADDLNNQAKSAADASTVSFAVALAALGVGAFLWLGDTQVAVSAGVGSVGVGGRF
jgi:hypothetical protein